MQIDSISAKNFMSSKWYMYCARRFEKGEGLTERGLYVTRAIQYIFWESMKSQNASKWPLCASKFGSRLELLGFVRARHNSWIVTQICQYSIIAKY
jgi:hypothetical protein